MWGLQMQFVDGVGGREPPFPVVDSELYSAFLDFLLRVPSLSSSLDLTGEEGGGGAGAW